jgi:hypothetical protein
MDQGLTFHERMMFMSHHFDTAIAKDDSRLNILDMYLFKGASTDSTAMIMTTNPDAQIFAPDTLHPEGLYAFRFDRDGDAREDIVFKFIFDDPRHRDGDSAGSAHSQHFKVVRAEGDEIGGDAGDLLVEGEVGEETSSGEIRAYVGVAAELWAADAFGFFTLVNALFKENRFADEAFQHKRNVFKNRNVMATVLEVPNSLLGDGLVHGWATVSLYGHAPETQVYRWGLPLFTHLFLSNPELPDLADRYHTSFPAQDAVNFGAAVTEFVSKLAASAGATEGSDEYGRQIASRICPALLPYEIGTAAEFDGAVFNGRPLHVDAFDVMLTLAANTPIADGVAPDVDRVRSDFPYCGRPYAKAEQAGLGPVRELIGLTY